MHEKEHIADILVPVSRKRTKQYLREKSLEYISPYRRSIPRMISPKNQASAVRGRHDGVGTKAAQQGTKQGEEPVRIGLQGSGT